jgi:hypothetical protein
VQYEVTQIISYLVTAETPEEAMRKWNDNPRTEVIEWQDNDIELYDESVEVNG